MSVSLREKKKAKRTNLTVGIVFIRSTFNNVLVAVTDMDGNTVAFSSAGMHNLRGSKKATPHAGHITARHAAEKAIAQGMKTVNVVVRGAGPSRDAAVKAVQAAGLDVLMVMTRVAISHNGSRPRKKRRV